MATIKSLKEQYPFWWPVRSSIPLIRGEGDTWLYGNVVNWDVDQEGVSWLKIQTDNHNHEAKLWVKADTTESVTIKGSDELSDHTYFPEVK